MYWEKCGQRFDVADEMWRMPRGVAEWGGQRNVFRMKQKVLERKEKKNNYSHGNGPRCVI